VASAVLAATVLGVGGCGGGQSDDDPIAGYDVDANTTMTVAKPPLAKAEFVARINGVCREAWAEALENWRVFIARQDPQIGARERYARAISTSFLYSIDFHVFDAIRQMGAPPGDEQTIEAIIGPFQATVELGWMERWRAYSIPEVVSRFETYNKRAAHYGLDDCLVDRQHLEPMTIRG
jgi:hypothetical protein